MRRLAPVQFLAALKPAFAILGCVVMIAGHVDVSAQTIERFVTQGPATTVVDNLYKCPVKVENHRVSAIGKIKTAEGRVFTVPAEVAFQKGGPKGADLYNECTRVTPPTSPEVSAANVPVVEVDKDGETITGTIVADN